MVSDSADDVCVKAATAQPALADKMREACACFPECDESEYELFTSQLRWPSRHYWPHLAEKYGIRYNNKTMDDDLILEIEEESLLNGTKPDSNKTEGFAEVRCNLLLWGLRTLQRTFCLLGLVVNTETILFDSHCMHTTWVKLILFSMM